MVNGSQCHLDTNLDTETADRVPKSTRYDLENMIYISSDFSMKLCPLTTCQITYGVILNARKKALNTNGCHSYACYVKHLFLRVLSIFEHYQKKDLVCN